MSIELHPHQQEALSKMQTGSVLVGGVGSGKSITALTYFTQLDPTKKIVVITTAKKRNSGEWWEDAMKMSLRNHLEVDSWNNIKAWEHEDAFFIFDEQRVVGKGAWSEVFIKIAKRQPWVLLSATPADVWVDLVPVFLAHGFYRNRTHFNDTHVKFSRFTKYPKIDGYYDVYLLEKYRDMVYVEMPFEKTAVRHTHMVPVDFSRPEEVQLFVDRWNIEEGVPLKDAGEMMRYLRKSANSDPSRMEAIKKIAAEHDRLIIFYTFTYELEILRTLHTELDIPVSEYNGKLHQSVPTGDRWIYLVQYQAGSEGWNCITTNAVVFYSLPYSYRQFEQAHGRVDRLNTQYTDLHYYILKSQAIIDKAIWKAQNRKKNFQASAFAKKAWPSAKPKLIALN